MQDPTASTASRGAGPLRVDRFELLGELGRGAIGVVYRARDAASGQEVALKLPLVRPEWVRLQRFLREGEVTASLQHPGIVGVHAMGVADGRPFLAYELVEGARALDEAARGAPLGRRVELVRDAARALGHAHGRGVVHRDVKPHNVLVDAAGRVRVADFGLAQALDHERLTLSGALLGTPGYMAPEQLQARRADVGPATDVWALGIMLAEVLTGQPPFPAASLPELLERVTTGAPVRPRAVDPTIPARLEAIVLRALEPDPAARYVDAEELARDLDRFLAGEEVLAAGRPGRRLGRRALAALTLAAGLGLAALAWRPSGRSAAEAPDLDAPVVDPLAAGAPAPDVSLDDLLREAAAALEDGRLDAALEALERAPAAAPALALRAAARLRRGDHADAERDAAEALGLDPSLAEAWAVRAAARLALDRLDEAAADATEALARDPRRPLALRTRAQALAGRDDATARADLDALLALDAGDLDALRRRARLHMRRQDRASALADVEQALAHAGRERGAFLQLRGGILSATGEPARGLVDIDAALETGPETASLRLDRSMALLALDRLEEARADAERGVALDPRHAQLRVHRAHLRMRQGRHAEAVEDAALAVALDPTVDRAHANLGFSLSRLRRDPEALEALDEAAAREPDAGGVRMERALVRARLGDHAGAEADLDHVIEHGSGIAEAYHQRGNLRARRGDLRGALADYDAFLALHPDQPAALHRRGLAHERLGDVEAARADWRRALALLDPGDRLAAELRSRLAGR